MRYRLRAAALCVLLATTTALTSCGNEQEGTTLRILAAASLVDVFDDLAAQFEDHNDGVSVNLSLGSSTDLAEQAADGAPGDVLATADHLSMALAEAAGVATDARRFAGNELVLVTPPDDPAGVSSLHDLAGTVWVRCADQAPCGRLARNLLAEAGISAEPASLEEDARATLDKVVAGEAAAALTYATDAAAVGEAVRTVPIPDAADHATSYYIAVLSQSREPALAQAWVDFVTSDEAEASLRNAGFVLP